MDKLPPPTPLVLTGDVAGNWKSFQQKLDLYLQAIGKDTANNKTKTAILLTIGGTESIELYNTFTFSDDDKEDGVVKYAKVLEKFGAYCDPQKNETYERYIFRSRIQKELEPISQFITDVKLKARTCNYGNLRDGILRDQIVLGVADKKN